VERRDKMDIHSSILRDEVRELEQEMSVDELIRHISSDNTLIDINNVLEDIARTNIIMRSEENE
jgi:hypothetical protein